MTVNIPMLRGRIVENGFNVDTLAKRIGINRATFYRKLNDKGLTFTVGEVHKMISSLHLTEEEASKIFLFGNSQ